MIFLSLNEKKLSICAFPFSVAWLCGVVLGVECGCDRVIEISGLASELWSCVSFPVLPRKIVALGQESQGCSMAFVIPVSVPN